ncbi:MAG: cell division protein ZipA C-terminal FtsZ-binding domain-containing protein [Stenotrophobium sp.]
MSALQWALLIIGVAVIVIVYFFSRREKPQKKPWTPPVINPQRNPVGDQMEIFGRSGEFDEFGVGKPRRREPPVMPGIPTEPQQQSAPAPAAPKKERIPERQLTPAAETVKTRREPVMEAVEEPAVAVVPEHAKPAQQVKSSKPAAEQKIVAILIAEREGTAILGPKLHRALQQQSLAFGERKIYHRTDAAGLPVFSVAGLLKPGQLDPAEAASFSTPGLTMFMVLPGPEHPEAALADLLATAKALARGMNAELFDAKRQPFTAEAEKAMVADIKDWTRRQA